MTNYEQMRFELALQKGIQAQLDILVDLATKTVCECIEPPKEGNKPSKEKSQIRNVINVASDTESVKVVTNFIRYQIARSGDDYKVWQENDFGHEVIAVIEKDLEQMTKRVIEKLKQSFSVDQSDQEFHRIHHQLTQLYLGYLNRCFYYVVEKKDNKKKLCEGRGKINATLQV